MFKLNPGILLKLLFYISRSKSKKIPSKFVKLSGVYSLENQVFLLKLHLRFGSGRNVLDTFLMKLPDVYFG